MKSFKNLSITKKILFITIFAFVLYTIFGAVVQMLFFERFYKYVKRDELSKQIESFAKEYAVLDDSEQINKAITSYTQNDSYMLIMNKSGDIIHSASYQMIVKAANGEKSTFFLDHFIRSKQFEQLELKVGDTVTVGYMSRGPMSENKIYMPISINTVRSGGAFSAKGIAAEPAAGAPHISEQDRQNISYMTGTIVYVPPRDAAKSMINRDESIHAAMDWMRRVYSGETTEVGKTIHYIYNSAGSGGTYCVVVRTIEQYGEQEMIFGVTTLKPVAEAVGVMQTLQVIWFAAMTAVVIAVAAVLARGMTKPVVEMTAVTTRMKNLDFSKRCESRSNDELGVLAQNINSMSEALDTAIRELKDANERLTDDIERERRAEQTRREFVAAVSHELKTPLAIIRAYSEGIIDGVSEKKQERYLNIIVDETKKMDALVLDMLENSKLEAGAEKLDLKEHNLSEVVIGIIGILEPRREEKNIKIECSADDTVTAVYDLKRIEQVITNFMTNALRHTPENGRIRVTVRYENGAYVSVENEGSHIEEAELEKIWDRFYKIDKSRGRSSESGTGLGLSISKNILALHKAEYFVRNTDLGVEFGFILKV